jgi:hypothetical protein
LIAQWLMPGDFRLEVGHRYTMQAKPVAATGFSGAIRAEVLVCTRVSIGTTRSSNEPARS